MAVRITPDISLKPAGIAVGLPIKSRRITGTTNPSDCKTGERALGLC